MKGTMKTKIRKRDTNDHTVILYDMADEKRLRRKGEKERSLKVKVQLRGNGIFVMPKGYGDCASQDGHGTPVMIEYYEGDLRVLVWSDINQEDPTYILSLDKALESKRKSCGKCGQQFTVHNGDGSCVKD